MPPSVSHATPAETDPVFPRSFGQRAPIDSDRWPLPLAAAAILALSLAGWAVLIQLGRFATTLVG